MESTALKIRVIRLEAQVSILKKKLANRQPDFAIDERNWKSVKPALKRARLKQYRLRYGQE